MSDEAASLHHDNNTRKCVNFTPSIWGNMFLPYASESKGVDDNMEHKVLKEKLKMFILSSDDDDRSVSQKQHGDDNLHSLALHFRLLRQHGYPVSSDVFEGFKDYVKGRFKNEDLTEDDDDVEGMLALYEAAQFEVHGENILDEAHHFTYTQLKSLVDNNQLSPPLSARVSHCLRQSLHKRLRRIETRHCMSFYQQQHPNSQNHTMLLNFAKLDFNMLQKLHKKELGNVTKWWNELASKVPYARNRLVESYFWPLAWSYEPQFSVARMVATKLICCICLLDDTYDVYGTLQELELFTEAIHRWDKSIIESLPECMKEVFEAAVQVCTEIEMVTAKEGASNIVMPHVKQAVKTT